MTVIFPGAEFTQQEVRGDEVVVFDATLAVADTSEVLFTVPVGKRLRSVAFTFRSTGNIAAFVSLTEGASATLADILVDRTNPSAAVDGLDLPEGDYEFIGGVGQQPRVRGFAVVGPALA